MKKYLFLLLAISSLSACGDEREAHDQKLARGCAAGIKSILAQDKYTRQIDKINNKKFSTGTEGRKITLEVTTKDKQYGYPKDETFDCTFAEVSNMLGYKAEVVAINVGEDFFGKKDGQIVGDMNDFVALTGAIEDGMK